MKKKLLIFAAIVVILACVACLFVFAETVASGTCGANGDNITWTLNDAGTLTISGEGEMADYSHSSFAPWKEYSSSIKNLIVEDGVTSIGSSAFFYCSALTSATIGNGVTSIGNMAFCLCDSLTSITIPDSVISIGDEAFSCSSLISVTIPDNVTSIGDEAFSSCNSLTSVTIPKSVTSISNDAFRNCWSLVTINIDDNNNVYTDINGVLFDKKKITIICYPAGKTATSYAIPDSVTSIGNYAFYDSNSLTNVTIPDSVTTIGDYAFEGCASLENVTIPDSVTCIGSSAFKGCWSLTNVTIGNSVTTIGDYAFEGCASLENVTIPDSVTSIGDMVFFYCDALTVINVDDNNNTYADTDGVLFDKNKTNIIYYPKGKTETSYAIPCSVTSIGDFAFDSCSSLINMSIPENVTYIGSSAFYGCNYLETITFIGTEEKWNAIEKNLFWDSYVGVHTAKGTYTLVFAPQHDVLYGDATGDGVVDGKDLVRLKKFLAAYDYDTGTSTVEVSAGADANGDGVIDGKDLVRLKKYIAAFDWDTGTSDVVLGPAA